MPQRLHRPVGSQCILQGGLQCLHESDVRFCLQHVRHLCKVEDRAIRMHPVTRFG